MAFKPTRVQQAAIDATGNVLVSAAAGSGKTAVLTERVVSLICNPESTVSADRILVATFTNAAAAEMRSRIEARLAEECEKHPDSEYLMRQMMLFPGAKICTIDSFCIDLVRENFDKLGVSPDFRIADSGIVDGLSKSAVSDVFEEQFSACDEDFLKLLKVIGSSYDDSVAADFVCSIFESTRQLPNPEEWLDNAAAAISLNTNGDFWFDSAFDFALKRLQTASGLISAALELLHDLPEVEPKYSPIFVKAADSINKLIQDVKNKNWNAIFYGAAAFTFDRAPAVRGYSDNAAFIAVKALRESVKGCVSAICSLFFAKSEDITESDEMLSPLTQKLIELVKKYGERLDELMRERNILTFYNTELLAFKFLCKYEKGTFTVNEDAREYLNSFDEILVDEYQDTNSLQDILFRVLSDNEKKLFVVGDVKQSIYGFRGADPKGFLEKKRRYTPYETAGENEPKKIILGNNFRSRAEICEYVNYFFEGLMTSQNGDIDYGAEERLYPLAEFPAYTLPPVEITVLNTGDDEFKASVCEADYIASEILKTMAAGPVIRDENNPGTLRCAKFSDFAVLLRSAKDKIPVYAAQLNKRGVPVAYSPDGYLQTAEISTVISLLDVMDNPTRDISLASVMLSPIFGFTADDLARIRAVAMDGRLISAVIAGAADNPSCKAMLDRLNEFRLEYSTMSLPHFLYRLYDETEYLDTVSAMPDGASRHVNLLMLIQYAKDYEQNEGRGISGFISHMRYLDSKGLGSAMRGNNSDAVKIMTVHKSKGLQFPVCIFAGCSSRFSSNDMNKPLLIDPQYYFAYKYYDAMENRNVTTLQRQVLINRIIQKRAEEELRLAYVAMTRAQDRLILLLSVDNPERKLQVHSAGLYAFNGNIDSSLFLQAGSFADWILTTALVHPDGAPFRDLSGIKLMCTDSKARFTASVVNSASLEFIDTADATKPEAGGTDFDRIKIMGSRIRNNLNYTYPYEELLTVASKSSVSQLANSAEHDKFAFKTKPSFASYGGLSAAQRGTATHRIMQFLDLKAAAENLDAELYRLREWQFITEVEFNAADRERIKAFISSPLCRRINESPLVKREMRFLTERPATQINAGLDRRFENEMIVIQGAVDCVFKENGGMVIVDFKTDRVIVGDDLVSAYGEQLEIYAGACEKIFGIPVKQKLLYSFHLNRQIEV